MIRTTRKLAFCTVMMVLCTTGLSIAHAQDSFGGAGRHKAPLPQQSPYPQRQAPPQQQMPQPQYPPSASSSPSIPMQGTSAEMQDFGIAPPRQLRPSEQLGGPTPTSIPGGQVIGTQQLAQLLQSGQGRMLLLHAYGSPEHLPGAAAVMPAAQGGSFDDQVQQGYGQYLQQATGGDKSMMLVVYCGGTHCWGSYNAALRAIHMGYRNVHWYRGGVDAWRQAGFPLNNAMAQQQGQ